MTSSYEQGRNAYRRGEYSRAIELFSSVINRDPSVQLLDNRAACYEKLEQLSAALKDAKATIHLRREDATGYLRAGKILQRMAKPSVALEVYSRGLEAVKHVGQGFQLLRKAQAALKDKTEPPRFSDPVSTLPLELLELIFGQLSFKQIVLASSVSRQWASFVRSNPYFWRHLDLSEARRKVRSAFLSRAINCGRLKLTTATLNKVVDFEKSLLALIKHCPLQCLRLGETSQLGPNVIEILHRSTTLTSIEISAATVVPTRVFEPMIAALSEQLQSVKATLPSNAALTFKNVLFPRIRNLSLRFECLGDIVRVGGLTECISHRMPQLTSLFLEANLLGPVPFNRYSQGLLCIRHTGLSCLSINTGSSVRVVVYLPRSITELALHDTHTACGFTYEDTELPNPYLEDLTLSLNSSTAHERLDNILGTSSTMQNHGEAQLPIPRDLMRLRLNIAPGIEPIVYNRILDRPRLHSLEHLELPRAPKFGDNELADVVRTMPKLKSLDLSYTEITGVGIRQAVDRCNLQQLNVSCCHNLGSDAVDWARSRGVKVEYRMTTPKPDGGRKLRFL